MKIPIARNYQKEPMNPLEAEIAITALQSTGEFTVLRKLNLTKDSRFSQRQVQGSKIGLCIDTETTGLDHTEDKIIELGIVAFEYNPETAEIIRIIDRYNEFEDPGCPIPEDVKKITRITDEMVAGHRFDDEWVRSCADRATLVIAHNAAFDRKFIEARYPTFARLPWACTMSQIDWQLEGINSRSLEYLLYRCGGFCINPHRALDDAEGLLGLLLGYSPGTGDPIFKTLLERSGEMISKICAVGAPYDKKDILKRRGYRWNDGSKNGCKGWWVNLPHNLEQDELTFLGKEIYPGGNTGSVEIKRIDAYARFSIREL
jgi:DNA polymerase-3 subunit epsilon